MAGDAWTRVHEHLRGLARNQFGDIEDAGKIAALQAAVHDLRASNEPTSPELNRFADDVAQLHQRGQLERRRAVALGLRLCMAKVPAAPVSKPAGKRGKQRKPPVRSVVDPGVPVRAGGKKTLEDHQEPKRNKDSSAASNAPGRYENTSSRVGDLPLTVLPRVGGKTADKLAARGLHTLEDVACFLPRAYRDLRARRRFEEAQDGEEVVGVVVIRDFRQGWFRGRYHAKMIVQQEHEGAPQLELRWFHPVGGLAQKVSTGGRLLVVGVIKEFRGTRNIVHPDLYDPESDELSISVVYPTVEGVGARTLARLCRAAVERLQQTPEDETLPPRLRSRRDLPARIDALVQLHVPGEETTEQAIIELARASSPAHRRLAYEELFLLQLALLQRRAEYRTSSSQVAVVPSDRSDDEALRACVPFELTGAQWRVIREIRADLAASLPMLRLLQGDVGSGKTVVAFAAALSMARVGCQTAIMAPTEILAEQHLRSLKAWCEAANLKVALLTGSTGKAQRNSLLALLGAGKIDVLVGTHALLVQDVAFASLGLVVVDEQHRFGVEQRDLLRRKGATPHLLVMTATPIPRSLALTAFGELDVSVIDELPPGRKPCATYVFAGRGGLDRARRGLCKLIGRGARAYVVCPLVEASEVLDVTDVEASAADLRRRLPEHPVGVVHGRMSAAEKERVLSAFRSGELTVLVATTVIEVGVDVPEATAILVEHAERFGLAQLHQLRGRVGRGQEDSYCLLHTANAPESEAGERLAVLEKHADGFTVAERDLELRGPGEVFGTQQAGMPRLRFARFTSGGLALLEQAREDAAELLADDPKLARHGALREALVRELERRDVFAGESG